MLKNHKLEVRVMRYESRSVRRGAAAVAAAAALLGRRRRQDAVGSGGRRDESVAGVGLCMAVDFVAEICGGAVELLPASDGDD